MRRVQTCNYSKKHLQRDCAHAQARNANIFCNQKVSKTTIYRIIAEYEQGIPCINLRRSGRPKLLTTHTKTISVKMQKIELEYYVDSCPGDLMFLIKQKYIAAKISKCRKRRKCPRYTEDQLRIILIYSRRLR